MQVQVAGIPYISVYPGRIQSMGTVLNTQIALLQTHWEWTHTVHKLKVFRSACYNNVLYNSVQCYVANNMFTHLV